MAEESSVKGVLYGWKEIASYIGCSPKTAMLYSKRQRLPVKKVSRRVMISKSMIEQWLKRQ